MFAMTSSAEIIREGNTFSVTKTEKTSTQTQCVWKDNKGITYPIYKSPKGCYYIIKVSAKSGKEYKYYLPKEVQSTIKNTENK